MHTPAMEEYLWWLKFYAAGAAFLGSFFGGLWWVINKSLARIDKRTEGIVIEVFREMAKELFAHFNAQFLQRDDKLLVMSRRLDGHELRMTEFSRQISWQSSRLSDIAIAGTTLASISLFPTPLSSKRERDRVVSEWQKLIPRDEIEPQGD